MHLLLHSFSIKLDLGMISHILQHLYAIEKVISSGVVIIVKSFSQLDKAEWHLDTPLLIII